jgi:hypothetical protein
MLLRLVGGTILAHQSCFQVWKPQNTTAKAKLPGLVYVMWVISPEIHLPNILLREELIRAGKVPAVW